MLLVHVFQEHVGRLRRSRQGIRMSHNIVALQEGHGRLNTAICLLLMWIDTHDMHFLGALQSYNLEHMQSTSRVQAPVIRHDYYTPLWQGSGDGNDRPWALFEYHVQSIVGLLLRFKVKKGVLTEHNEVIPLGRQQDLLSRETSILEDLAGDICLGTALCTVLQELLYFVAGVRE